VIGQVRRAPLGVALCMGPSNCPLNETYTTLLPALIMGNTAVMKTPRPGTLLHAPLLEALRDAFPRGVVNTVSGTGRAVAPPMMASGGVDVLASKYGQQVSVFGRDPETIGRLIDPLVNQVCRVNINSQCQRGPDVFPFTGRKDSAEGTLSVGDALRVFSIRTLVAAKEHPDNRALVSRIVRERRSSFLNTDFIL
jgi:acyl-CoA reductase-like NAD-dependent aldehyde dehydrogenase